MIYKNGFFQLAIKDDGIYMKLFPPMNGGKPIMYDDVTAYLAAVKIKEFDIKALHGAISTAKEPKEVKIGNQMVLPEDELVKITVSEDKMKVVGRFYPPSTGGKLMKKDYLVSELVRAKVKFGIKEQIIDAFLKSRCYCTDVLLAEGMKPTEGRNAEIVYSFNTDKNSKPKINEDGSVDFHQLDMISSVNKGDVLATLIPADFGKPGIDVLGNAIKPAKVINRALKFGKNAHLSEDGTVMYSDVSGHVQLEGDKVTISDTYEVMANVDTSTGDINYEGNVHIKGNVITGFSVYAKGDIEVDGVVEGATLVSEGQIILKRGIQGMNKGKLIAKGNVIAKFIESSEVKSGGYVSTGTILHSKISAKGDILVDGRNGSVTGGELRSGTLISVKTAGSTMGTHTLLEVGIDPGLIDEYHQLEKDIPQLKLDKTKLEQVVNLLRKKVQAGEKLTSDKQQHLQNATKGIIELDQKLKKACETYESMQIEIENTDGGKIKVSNIAYPGVKIVISNVVYFVRSDQQYCQFIRDKADIKVISYL